MTQKRIVEVVAYNPAWQDAFQTERALLQAALGEVAVAIHHVGSTSVPGLAAKPIIDILLAVTDLAALDGKETALAALGYKAKGENGIPGRRYFHKGGPQRTHHAHAFTAGDPNLTRHLAFRDYLIAHADVTQEYAALKKRLAAAHKDDSKLYQTGKEDFISLHERLAFRWRRGLDEKNDCVWR
jgi:GrpB-like predicted nucleotidyltransferase (UPF0157 family)